MSEGRYRYLFGPVPSRRLGRSLGIDPVPHKTCSFDCVYCQLGRTTRLTTTRLPYVPAAEIIAELDRWLDDGGAADFLTLSGSGEPTLNSEIGQVIAWAKSHTGIPVAVLTNGSLLWDPAVREDLAEADVVIPSLDAALPRVFRAVNRPCAGLCLDRVIAGLRALRRQLAGEVWLEVMLVKGLNDTPADLSSLREAVDFIAPHRVQINTVVRPPAEAWAQPLSPDDLAVAAGILGPTAEIIAPLPEGFLAGAHLDRTEDDVVEMLRRRPCTLDDIAEGLSLHRNEVGKYLANLVERDRVRAVEQDGTRFYLAAGGPPATPGRAVGSP
jgi:wyosine [tRNA(Phe)-imidazoG37] synthetase (radical SAM superfamily)